MSLWRRVGRGILCSLALVIITIRAFFYISQRQQHFRSVLSKNAFFGKNSVPLYHSTALTNYFAEDGNDDVARPSSFDADFAEAMCKPLPKWYQRAEEEREEVLKELEMNRDRILNDFKSKYEVSEEQKAAESKSLSERYKQRIRKSRESDDRKVQQQKGFFGRIFGSSASGKTEADSVREELETVTDVDLSSKEKWEAFWKEEEEQTGFSLPGFFEVFPELKLRWPTWARRKDGSAIECERDQDCPFPLACCPHPIIPGQKFCCSGWGQRVLVKAYQPQEIVSEAMVNRGKKGKDISERESWRPDPNLQ